MELLVPMAFILIGLVLIGLEVYVVPGINVVGVLGVIGVGVGVVLAFVEGGPLAGSLAFVGAGAAGAGLYTYLWRSGAADRFVLRTELRETAAAAAEQDSRARLMGKTGVALSPLRPTGVADIDGVRVEVRTEGAFIAAGSRVRVVAMDRSRFFVRMADEEQPRLPEPPAAAPAEA